MLLRLPANLHYPITINRIEAAVGASVQHNDNLFLYSYVTKVKQGARNEEEETEVDKKFTVPFQSTLEGVIKSYRVWEGDVLTEPVDICEVEEECPHTVQFLGMCTNCGRDMTENQPGSGLQDTDRAKIQALHDTQYLTISESEANKIDEEAKRRLLRARKLSLVVDLDQTIIHAAVDPTIAEWQKDKDNPNYEAVKDVRAFQLIDDGPGMRGCWYYIKLRPGLMEFLEHIAQLYELHIYTMGTRQYAQQIANIVDPNRKFFSDRILSRDESGSMVAKNLERLFPVDTKMVVIIDDRGDVWKWSANLIRVTPFDFFVGIGDINSSFLPKQQEIQATPQIEKQPEEEKKEEQNGESKTNGVAEDGTSTVQHGISALEQLVAMSGSDDPVVREMQSKGQEEAITSQLEEKPLLRMQQELDEKDGATATEATNGELQPTQTTESDSSESSDSSQLSPTPSRRPRHSVLKNDDEELTHLEARLTAVHNAFYREYDRKRLSGKGGRVAELAGKKKARIGTDQDDSSPPDLQLVPDVKKVMPSMKVQVLAGVVIVFSGVLPLGTDVQNADISTWAKTFGAKITDRLSQEVTHVIAARVGTTKVKQAVRRGIKVVGTPWLIQSIQRWRKLDERPFLLEGAGQKRNSTIDQHSGDMAGDAFEKTHVTSHDFLLSSSEDESTSVGLGDTEDDFPSDDGQPPRKRLKIETSSARPMLNDEEVVDDTSPITINQDEWADMDAELKEFMGSEAESESDTDSVSSKLSHREKRASKRSREEDEAVGHQTQPRRNGGSGLKSVANITSGTNSTGTNTPDITDDQTRERAISNSNREEKDEDEFEDSGDELARALERELEEAESGDE